MAPNVQIDDWDEAYRRVEGYLQACGVGPRVVLTELAVRIIEQARKQHGAQITPESPVAVAVQILFREMADSFGQADATSALRDEHRRARGRLMLATTGTAPEWAKFLGQREEPHGVLEPKLFEQPLQTGPELRLSKLPPAQIEYAFGDNDEDTSVVGRRIPIAAVALAMSVVGVMGAAWAATH